jgi:hypothetical protein
MTKKKKDEDEKVEQPKESRRELVLAQSPKNSTFFHRCKAYKKYKRTLEYEGQTWSVEYAEYDRAENKFSIGLVLVEN